MFKKVVLLSGLLSVNQLSLPADASSIQRRFDEPVPAAAPFDEEEEITFLPTFLPIPKAEETDNIALVTIGTSMPTSPPLPMDTSTPFPVDTSMPSPVDTSMPVNPTLPTDTSNLPTFLPIPTMPSTSLTSTPFPMDTSMPTSLPTFLPIPNTPSTSLPTFLPVPSNPVPSQPIPTLSPSIAGTEEMSDETDGGGRMLRQRQINTDEEEGEWKVRLERTLRLVYGGNSSMVNDPLARAVRLLEERTAIYLDVAMALQLKGAFIKSIFTIESYILTNTTDDSLNHLDLDVVIEAVLSTRLPDGDILAVADLVGQYKNFLQRRYGIEQLWVVELLGNLRPSRFVPV